MKPYNAKLIIPPYYTDKYEVSDYNLLFRCESGYAVFNTVSTDIVMLDDLNINETDIDELLEMGSIVPAGTSELGAIRSEYESREKFSDTFHIIIAPTLNCTFRCWYCYEQHEQKYMSTEVADAILRLIASKAREGKNISVVWYGGEPLLNYSMILYLSERILNICRIYDVGYRASMITNGYCFTDRMISELDVLQIRSIQITIDGMKEEHEKRRPLIGGGESFERIIANIRKIKVRSGAQVKLRINVDQDNIEDAYRLVRCFANMGLTDLDLTLGLLKEFGCDHRCTTCNKLLFSTEEFAEEFVRFRRYIGELGFYNAYDKMQPEYKVNSCTLDCPDAYVIDPDGEVYKCISQVGQTEHSIGNVQTGFNEFAHLRYTPYSRPECVKCVYFPICKGGCLNNTQLADSQRCEIWKYITGDLIEMDYLDAEESA